MCQGLVIKVTRSPYNLYRRLILKHFISFNILNPELCNTWRLLQSHDFAVTLLICVLAALCDPNSCNFTGVVGP